MAERIPQSTSYLVVFRAYLASDGKTPATGKTIAVTISKNGGAFGNPNAGATNATEISSGFYKFTLDATDANTPGPLAWRGAEAAINDAGDVLTVATDAASIVAAAFAHVMEGSLSFAEYQRIMFAVACGITTRLDGGWFFRDLANSKARVQATLNANGERTTVTTDGT